MRQDIPRFRLESRYAWLSNSKACLQLLTSGSFVTADIFLPSYASHHDSSELERKQDPVDDIVLTDEEAAAMFPQ